MGKSKGTVHGDQIITDSKSKIEIMDALENYVSFTADEIYNPQTDTDEPGIMIQAASSDHPESTTIVISLETMDALISWYHRSLPTQG